MQHPALQMCTQQCAASAAWFIDRALIVHLAQAGIDVSASGGYATFGIHAMRQAVASCGIRAMTQAVAFMP
eukprot:1158034-Pelagomonas_calceolata.AAC.4